MISFSYSSLNDEKTQCDRFEPRINPQDSKNGYGYYQLWITANMSVCLSLSDTDCRKLMDVLGSRPPLPTENDAPVRNAAVAEPMRSILDATFNSAEEKLCSLAMADSTMESFLGSGLFENRSLLGTLLEPGDLTFTLYWEDNMDGQCGDIIEGGGRSEDAPF